MKRSLPYLVAAVTVVAGCSPEATSGTAEAAEATPRPGVVVDSAFPMPEALHRFQATIDEPAPVRLEGGAASLEELFARLVAAYASRDADALDGLAMTRGEFGYLYYPESPYPEPPFELAPDFLWYMVEQRGMRGVGRATEMLTGEGTEYLGFQCPGAVKEEGETRLWGPCLVRVRLPSGIEESLRLANAIAERDGRFKLIGFDNGL
jgi:hypothetical protein